MKERFANTVLLSAVLVAFIAFWAIAGPGLRHAVEHARASRGANFDETNMRQRNESAFGQILGEARASMADLLFVKTNRYLHAGVGYASRLNTSSGEDSRMFSSCTPGTPTMIRQKNADFRWILGDLERQVKPYQDASESHVHLTADELTPWYRVITLVNPNYIRAYRIGAKTLGDDKKWEEALAFLQEGIRNNKENPEVFLLYQSLTLLHMRGRLQPGYPWGKAWLGNALAAARKGYELGRKQRPPLGQSNKIYRDIMWTDDYEEDFRYCAHVAPLLLREQGRLDEALKLARKAYADCPNFKPLQNLVNDLSDPASEKISGKQQ